MDIIRVGVCKGRHEMPVENYVFDFIEDPTDVNAMREVAIKYFFRLWEKLPHKNCYFCDENGNDVPFGKVDAKIEIYVTGLTVAVIEVLQAALYYFSGFDITLMHFDLKSGEYFPQRLNIVTF